MTCCHMLRYVVHSQYHLQYIQIGQDEYRRPGGDRRPCQGDGGESSIISRFMKLKAAVFQKKVAAGDSYMSFILYITYFFYVMCF